MGKEDRANFHCSRFLARIRTAGLLKLATVRLPTWSYNFLAVELGMSPSEVHAARRRAVAARLAVQNKDKIVHNIRSLEEFRVYEVNYVFVPNRGGSPGAY